MNLKGPILPSLVIGDILPLISDLNSVENIGVGVGIRISFMKPISTCPYDVKKIFIIVLSMSTVTTIFLNIGTPLIAWAIRA